MTSFSSDESSKDIHNSSPSDKRSFFLFRKPVRASTSFVPYPALDIYDVDRDWKTIKQQLDESQGPPDDDTFQNQPLKYDNRDLAPLHHSVLIDVRKKHQLGTSGCFLLSIGIAIFLYAMYFFIIEPLLIGFGTTVDVRVYTTAETGSDTIPEIQVHKSRQAFPDSAWYYRLLMPALIPILWWAAFLHWLTLKMFRHS